MTNRIDGLRRAAAGTPGLIASGVVTVAIVVTAVVGLITTGDSTSGKTDRGSGRQPTAGSSAGVTISAPSSAAASSSASRSATRSSTAGKSSGSGRRSGDDAAACTDVDAIKTVNASLDQSSLAKVKPQFVAIDRYATKLDQDAPSDIAPAAKKFLAAIRTLRSFIDRARSIDDLSQQAQSNATLSGAFSSLTTSDQKITAWAAAKC